MFLARFSGGAAGVFEATRFATGRKNAIRVEINGSLGSLAFDFEDMNVLQFFDASLPDDEAGFRRILVTEPTHPYIAAWWPPGHGLGYEHGFTHQVVDLVTAIAQGREPTPTFAEGLQIQRVLDAVETSSATRSWQSSRSLPDARPRASRRPGAAPSHLRSTQCHAPSPCSPASGPTCRSRRSAGSPPIGATTASRSPVGATTSTRGRPPRTTPTCRESSTCSRGTTSRPGRSPTTSPARPCATTRSTLATRRSCPTGSGVTETPRACASVRPRR